jgi:hypothetical protein
MAETSEQAVIATFENAAAAEQAAHDLREWDKANDDIKLGAIGMVTKNAKGEIQTRTTAPETPARAPKWAWVWACSRQCSRVGSP